MIPLESGWSSFRPGTEVRVCRRTNDFLIATVNREHDPRQFVQRYIVAWNTLFALATRRWMKVAQFSKLASSTVI